MRSVGRRPPNPYTIGKPVARAVQRYMGLGVCGQRLSSYRSRSEVNPSPSCARDFRYCRLRAYNSRAVGRRPLNLYTAGRPTSRAIQWYTGLLVCNHCVVSYAPITVISPLIWDDQVALGVPPCIQNQPSGHMGGARYELPVPSWCPFV